MGEHWALFLYLAGVIVILNGTTLLFARTIIGKCTSEQDKRIGEHGSVVKTAEQKIATLDAQLSALVTTVSTLVGQIEKAGAAEKQLLELKAILPLDYVRKEDFIRHELVINTKLDRIFDEMKRGRLCQQ
jgi:hypothetical protein